MDANTNQVASPAKQANADEEIAYVKKISGGKISDKGTIFEEFEVAGDSLLALVTRWLYQDNIRRIFIKNKEGHTLIKIPLIVEMVGTHSDAATSWEVVGVGIIGAVDDRLIVVVERQE